jgi:mitotic spindle assembly checkpoint protein MAD1
MRIEAALANYSSMTQSFPSGETPEESASTLQAKLSSLSTLHHQATAELAAKESEIGQLHARLADSTNISRVTIAEMIKEKTRLEQELRWTKQAAESAEIRERTAIRELDIYRSENAHNVSQLPSIGHRSTDC